MTHQAPQPSEGEATQVAHPAKATIRTALQVLIGLAVAIPIFITESGVDATIPVIATALGVSAAVARIMAIPMVNLYLTKYLGLGAQPGDVRSDIV